MEAPIEIVIYFRYPILQTTKMDMGNLGPYVGKSNDLFSGFCISIGLCEDLCRMRFSTHAGFLSRHSTSDTHTRAADIGPSPRTSHLVVE